MPKIRISRSSVRGLIYPGKQTDYFDTKLIGFGVRVNQNSSSYFVQCHVKNQKEIKTTIGKVGVWTFDDALTEAKRIIEDAAHGISPVDRQQEKKAHKKKQQQQNEITLSSMLTEYLTTRKNLRERTQSSYKELIETYLEEWKELPMKDITGAMVIERHALIGKRSPAMADGAMRVVRALYNYAMVVHEEVITRNPVQKLSTLNAWYKVGRRKIYLHPDDIKRWLPVVMEMKLRTQRDFILTMLFTGCRRSEAACLTWGDINIEAEEIIFRDTKNSESLEVPLCKFLVKILKERKELFNHEPEDWVFPSYGKRGRIFDIRNTLEVLHKKTGIRLSNHDLRRSFQTYCNTLRIPPYTIKRLVNHALPVDVTEGYIQFPMAELRFEVERVAVYILDKSGLSPLGTE